MGILLVLVVVFLVYYFLRDGRGHNFHRNYESDALDLLKKRYVNGEIDDETYKKMEATLRK